MKNFSQKQFLLLAAISSITFSACAANPMTTVSTTTTSNQTNAAAALMNFRVSFNNNDYYSASVPQALANCAGDAKNYYDAVVQDPNTGRPLLFPLNSADATTTIKPSFIKDVSVDLTYSNSTATENDSYSCSYGSSNGLTPSLCSSFDDPGLFPLTYVSDGSTVTVDQAGYGYGYYSMFNGYCSGAGPISSPSESALLSGGVYFDIDRTQLGTNENLLLQLTSIPFNYASTAPAILGSYSVSDNALFNIHLISTGLPQTALEVAAQPRFLTYDSSTQFPQVAKKIATLAPATGQIREEQIIIPLAANPTADRIRVEKYSGSAILVSASIYRMGAR